MKNILLISLSFWFASFPNSEATPQNVKNPLLQSDTKNPPITNSNRTQRPPLLPIQQPRFMIVSARDPALALNAWNGAKDGTILRLHKKCKHNNPDCLWRFQNGMLVSVRNPRLAINAWNGAQHGTVLRLNSSCTPSNPDCRWKYTQGMFSSARHSNLKLSSWSKARHGSIATLHNGCKASNPDCVWTLKPLKQQPQLRRSLKPLLPTQKPQLRWSHNGPIKGMYCTQWHEPSDPNGWDNNYLCSHTNLKMRWSNNGPIQNMKCTRVYEASDPHTWKDNYICLPNDSPIQFFWSSDGAIHKQHCTQITEPKDPHTWKDNYICFQP